MTKARVKIVQTGMAGVAIALFSGHALHQRACAGSSGERTGIRVGRFLPTVEAGENLSGCGTVEQFRLSGGPVTAVFDDGIPVRAHVTDDGTLAIELAEGREVLVYPVRDPTSTLPRGSE
ncbi:hypothetical protein [Streptomyces sp. NBC_00076]|uniref:hypothetical protein n=1 Tax=Streptomyces sp. NBC_00076 TaxID=2975642 RepID=UPI003254AFD8